MVAAYLEDYDFNLPLIDAVNDPELDGWRSQLAAFSLGEGLDAGYYAAQELADLLLGAARADNEGVPRGRDGARLMELVGSSGDHYAATLYGVVAGLAVHDAAAHMSWLAALMRTRADMYRAFAPNGVAMPPLPGA